MFQRLIRNSLKKKKYPDGAVVEGVRAVSFGCPRTERDRSINVNRPC